MRHFSAMALIIAMMLPPLQPALAQGASRVETATEKLVYTAGFRLLSAGTATMQSVTTVDSLGQEQLHITALTRTYPLFDRLYKIDDRIDLWLDPATAQLRKIVRNLNEGSYHHRDTSWVDADTELLYANGDTLATGGPIFDSIGAIYHMRRREMAVGDTFMITIFDGKKLRPIAIKVSGPVSRTVPAGTFSCLALLPTSLDGRKITKSGDLLRIWVTDDQRRLPVQIEQRSNYGMLVLKLAEWSGP